MEIFNKTQYKNVLPFSYGEIHDQSAQGFELAGNIDEGECAIRFVLSYKMTMKLNIRHK